MADTYDVIVIGAGSMGSAAMYQLARRGFRVLGLDQFAVPHENGSHSGQSRIIRKAYFEHPDYVPLLERSYQAWAELESETGLKFYTETGLLYAGPSESVLIKGVRESAGRYQVPVHQLSPAEAHVRYPAFRIPSGYDVLLEPAAGFLKPEQAIAALVSRATDLGAELKTGIKVNGWSRVAAGVEVATQAGVFRADRLIIAAGSWAGHLIPELKPSLTVTRQVMCWFHTRQPETFAPDRFPCWLLDEADTGHVFYGFPQLNPTEYPGPEGLKFARHNPGTRTEAGLADTGNHTDEIDLLRRSAENLFPGQVQGLSQVKTCLYTYSPDEHFMIDLLSPHDGRVVVAAGFSGHGFKFVPVIGEILADLAVDGKTGHPAKFLSLGNRALR